MDHRSRLISPLMVVVVVVMMVIMIMTISISHDCVDLSAQCAEGDLFDLKKTTQKSHGKLDIKLFTKQVDFQRSTERHGEICFPEGLWKSIPEVGAELKI